MYNDKEPFFGIQRDKGVYKMPEPHFHNHHELYFLTSGKTKYFVNGEIFMLSPGDLIFIPKGDFHQTNYPDPENIERVTMTFNDEFLGEQFKSYTDNSHTVKLSDSYKLAQDAAKFINANYSQALTLESMAEKYSVNADYFSKIFKKATGVGFSKYLNATRISVAQELLATTTMSATDVALECGFNDSNYFIQVFKKTHGLTPKKYSMQFH